MDSLKAAFSLASEYILPAILVTSAFGAMVGLGFVSTAESLLVITGSVFAPVVLFGAGCEAVCDAVDAIKSHSHRLQAGNNQPQP